ncbi:MAG: TIGR00153 family protein [Gammaproteobacteria bacterium]|nr:TIGR00153 family protein [Gammaproteobacteria bacterium]
MKTTNPIAKLLGSSPFKPLQAQMRLVDECVSEVSGLFDALINNDEKNLKTQVSKIVTKEREANELKNNLRAHLPKSLFMPVDRSDLLGMLEMQDSIANTSKHIAGLLSERPMEVPADMADSLKEFVMACIKTCNHSHMIVEELDELIEAGFSGREAANVQDMVAKLNQLEADTDSKGFAIKQQLFALEDQMSPVSVMMWYQIIQWLGELADEAENVGERISLMVAS